MHLVEDALVVGIRVNGVHQAALDAESIIQHFGGGSEAVGGARSVRDNVMPGGIIHVFIDAQHHCQIFAFGRGGNDDLLRAALEMRRRFIGISEKAGRFDHQVDTIIAPGDEGRITLRENLDSAPINDDRVSSGLDFAGETAIGGVIFEQVSVGRGISQVIDGYDFQFARVAFENSLQRLASDAPEAVNADTCGHTVYLLLLSIQAMLVGWLASCLEILSSPDITPASQDLNRGTQSSYNMAMTLLPR